MLTFCPRKQPPQAQITHYWVNNHPTHKEIPGKQLHQTRKTLAGKQLRNKKRFSSQTAT